MVLQGSNQTTCCAHHAWLFPYLRMYLAMQSRCSFTLSGRKAFCNAFWDSHGWSGSKSYHSVVNTPRIVVSQNGFLVSESEWLLDMNAIRRQRTALQPCGASRT